jgi:Sulfocyanin (SoxE) domain
MFRSRPAPSTSLIVACVVAALALCGCAKDDRERPITVSSTGGSTAAANPAMPAADTGAAPLPVDTPPPASPAQPKAKPVALPKPSIDPARKPASPEGDATAPASQDKSLSYDAATNTVTFELIAGPFTFNGYRNGGATLAVLPKANMVINFVNKDGTPHSAIVISGEGPIPNAASDAAIPRAYTNKALEGLPQEAGDVMRFQMPETGTYRIFCGVPGHGLSGMWIWLKVEPGAKAPTFGPTKA